MSDPKRLFNGDDEVRVLVEDFEACAFHPSEFRHYQHLTVALWYLSHFTYDEAAERMKAGIRRLAATYGKMGYHETITEFWLRVVSNFLARGRVRDSIAVKANQLIARYDDKNLVSEHYSAELLGSAKAKEEWVEPDLKPMARKKSLAQKRLRSGR
jgi:hypothetical protein